MQPSSKTPRMALLTKSSRERGSLGRSKRFYMREIAAHGARGQSSLKPRAKELIRSAARSTLPPALASDPFRFTSMDQLLEGADPPGRFRSSIATIRCLPMVSATSRSRFTTCSRSLPSGTRDLGIEILTAATA
jgi:hypothetical protein